MKNLKIRIWVKPEKKFYFMNIEELLNETFSKWEMSELEIQVFTGLFDKRGKEIYEGDIVRFRGHSWDIDGNHYHPIKTEKIVFEGGAFDCNYRYEEDCYDVGWEEVEVIGNIYENKELLMEGN